MSNPDADRVPSGTILAVSDSVDGKTYVATGSSIELLQGMRKYEFESHETPPECVLPSPDGRALIVRTIDHSYVFNAGTMRLTRKLMGAYAWWEGSSVAWLVTDGRIVHAHGRMFSLKRRGASLISADETGKNFIGVCKVKNGTKQTGNMSTYQFVLCCRKGDTVRIRKTLVTRLYDPGSEGQPRHLVVIDAGTAMFGIPNGSADGYDNVGVLQDGHVTDTVRDAQGHPLRFAQSPVVINHAMVALVDAVNSVHAPLGRYIVFAGNAKVRLKKVGSDITFVTYDGVRKRVGLGVKTAGDVTITWKPESEFLR